MSWQIRRGVLAAPGTDRSRQRMRILVALSALTSASHAAARAPTHPRGSASNSRRYTEHAVSFPGRTAVARSGSGDGLTTS